MAGRRGTVAGVAAGLAIVLLTSGCGSSRPIATASGVSCTQGDVLGTWPLRRLAWQTVVVPVQESDVAAVTDPVAAGAGGVLLFGSDPPVDLGSDLQELTAKGQIRPLVMSDEEGGDVQRLADLVGIMPSARSMGATMTPRQVRRLAHRVGGRMADLGVTMDLAPVLDLDDGPGPDASNPIGTRSFSIKVRRATAHGLAFARGLRAAGVVPVVKHFPGLGEATANTDVSAAWTKPWSTLKKRGLRPFAAAVAAGMPAVMVSNARTAGLTRKPASLSFAATRDVLRRQLGFHGLVVTDALSGGAIRDAGYDVPRASVRALRVGADLVLFTAEPSRVTRVARRTVRAVVSAVRAGVLSRSRLRRAVAHVLGAKDVQLCP
jgi:beta-N-acetylhexosaminidase